MKKITQKGLILEYYVKNPDRDIPTAEIVDWATLEWRSRTGKILRDPDRAIRSLYQEDKLIKIAQGIYRFNHDPDFKSHENFTALQKEKILKKDNYKCVICGKGREHGVMLHIDHIRPKDLGGKALISNGQTLCSQHNMLKKNLNQTETGKKMFIRLYDLAQENQESKIIRFCQEILEVYEKHGMNGHIHWKK